MRQNGFCYYNAAKTTRHLIADYTAVLCRVLDFQRKGFMATANKTISVKGEQTEYETLARACGSGQAIFFMCVRMDRPYFVACLPGEDEQYTWIAYMKNVAAYNKTIKTPATKFLDGETDMSVVVSESEDEHQPGTPKQRQKWGTVDGYTTSDYKQLDAYYEAYSADTVSSGRMDAKADQIFCDVAKLKLDQERARRAGDVKAVKTYNDTIQSMLSSENLRKKDSKPMDNIRVDAITDRLEKAGLLENAECCDPHALFYRIFGYFPECKFCVIRDTDKCKYQDSIAKGIFPYTKDAVEQMILINENRMRENDGQPTLSTLPDEMRLVDNIGEFAKTPNKAEIEAYEKLGLVRMPPVGGTGNTGYDMGEQDIKPIKRSSNAPLTF